VLLTEKSSLIRLIRKPGGYYIGRGKGIGIGISVSSLISIKEVITSVGD
jgi:hypothetical protein